MKIAKTNMLALNSPTRFLTKAVAICGTLFIFATNPHGAFALDSQAPEKNKAAKSDDKVLAEINAKQIKNSEVEFELQRRLGSQLNSLTSGKAQINLLRKRVLDKMIERELLVQAATKLGLKASDSDVSTAIDKIKAHSGSSENWASILQEHKIDEAQFRKGIEGDLSIQSYITKEVYKDITVDEKELRAAFDADPKKYTQPNEVRARHILLKVKEGAKDEVLSKVKKTAEKILADAKKDPSNFAKLAETHSEGPTKTKGGDLGYFTKNKMVKPFADAAFSLKPGDISDLVKTQFGFHIIKVEDKRGGGEPKYKEVSEQIKQQMLRTRRTELLSKRLKKLREQAKIVVHLTDDNS